MVINFKTSCLPWLRIALPIEKFQRLYIQPTSLENTYGQEISAHPCYVIILLRFFVELHDY